MYLYLDVDSGKLTQEHLDPDQEEMRMIDNGELRCFKYNGVELQFYEAGVDYQGDKSSYTLIWLKVIIK